MAGPWQTSVKVFLSKRNHKLSLTRKVLSLLTNLDTFGLIVLLFYSLSLHPNLAHVCSLLILLLRTLHTYHVE